MKNVADGRKTTETVIAIKEHASIKTCGPQSLNGIAINKGTGIVFRPIDTVGICSKRGNVMAIDRNGESQGKLAITTAAPAFLT
ncbi:hypothetical protein D3C80_2038810 [compost metagenome]